MVRRAAKRAESAGARNGAREVATVQPMPRAGEPRITRADFDEVFARTGARSAGIEAINARVGRRLGG